MGKALDDVKVNLKGQSTDKKREFVEERINSLSGLNTGGFSESSKNFNKSILVGGSHTYSMGMLKLKDIKEESEFRPEGKGAEALRIDAAKSKILTSQRNTTANTSVANLLDSHPSTASGISPTHVTHTNSKTILHQAYLQALKQSSSMQELSRVDDMPGNILNRSNAELSRTRQNFLDQYEMVNQYNASGPSYKFTMSQAIIDSVATVIKNNATSKEYVLEKQKQGL